VDKYKMIETIKKRMRLFLSRKWSINYFILQNILIPSDSWKTK